MHADHVTQDPARLLAVVGMAGRFPGADDIGAFWQRLLDEHDAIGPVPTERWDSGAQLDPHKRIQSVGGFLSGIDRFDATFFGISPREAEALDPQQRLMLETTWQALEDAGTPAGSLAGSRTGVYVGAQWHDYEILRRDRGAGATQHSAVGAALDVIAARVSYFLGLTGPSMAVETACSSSLVALHLAGQALRQGEIDAAVVGGVNVMLTPDVMIGLTHFGGLSPDGRCQTFSASANGFVRGEGVVALYVKTLARAVEDGDRIHGVIAGTAVNNDGGGESLVTPNPAGQEDLLRSVYGRLGIPVDEVAYLEAHGTGTKRGDPIEAGVIGHVLGQPRSRAMGPLPIGSVKTNIGHLEACAGMAGLVKAMLVLKHRTVPPSLHSEVLNPDIPFDELNLHVVRERLPLPADGRLFAGVSSFGWGGTNAHVCVMSPPPTERGEPCSGTAGERLVLPLSAHSQAALEQRALGVAEALAAQGAALLPALAGTLAWQRDHFPFRAAFTGTGPEEIHDRLTRYAAGPDEELPGVVSGRAAEEAGRVAFVFPGQGSQWAGMGRQLLATDPVFAAVIQRCAKALEPHFPWDLVKIVAGEAGEEWLSRIDMLQPTLWAVSVSLAEVWRAAGVEPDVVIGHSQGEVTAATVAGALSYEDAALVMARRSAIARRTSGKGLMLAVDLDVEGARAAIKGFEHGVSLAVNNGPSSCVLSGDSELIQVLKEILEAEGTFCRLVNVDYASHSPQMDELEEDLLAALGPVTPRQGTIELLSTVRLTALGGCELDARYWVDNLRRPVAFADALDKVFDDGVTHVVEISPHPVLTPAIEQLAAQRTSPPRVLSTLRRDSGSPQHLCESFARAYVAGLAPFNSLPRKAWAPAPGYPWQRTAHWIRPGRRGARQPGLDIVLAPSVTEQDRWTGTLEVALEDQPWLRDHQVHDAVVLPGAAMLAFAVRTALARTGDLPGALADIAFRSDLTLSEDAARVSVQWRDEPAQGGSFTLASLPPGATAWTEHAVARALPPTLTPEVAVPRFPEHLLVASPMEAEEFYASCAAKGLNYGPAFRGVNGVRRGEGETLAEVHLSEQCLAGARARDLHPALWDGAMQVSLPLAEEADAVVPTSVRRVHLLQDLAEPVVEVWSYAVCRGHLLFDVYFYDAGRRPLLVMEGLRLTPLAVTAQVAGAETDRIHRLVFTSRPRAVAEPRGTVHGTWAVCAPSSGIDAAGALAGALGALGAHTATAVVSGDDAVNEAVWAERLCAAGEVTGVAFLAPRADDGLEAQREGLLGLAALVRACLTLPTPPRVAVVTTGAQAALAADLPDAGSALYWGFGRVLRREHAELRPLLLDLGSGEAGWAADCAAELLAEDEEDQVALRGTDRFAGRLLRGPDGSADPRSEPAWHTPPQPFRLAAARLGAAEPLECRPLGRRAPAPGEIEIAVRAAAVSTTDVPRFTESFDELYGLDATGVVTRVGEGVTRFAEGDRVVGCAPGALASYQILRADHALPLPGHMDEATAVALPSALTAAWYALHEVAGLGAGRTVLIHEAASGPGLAAVQVAQVLGAEVIATASGTEQRDHLTRLGIERVFDSRDLSWAHGVREATVGRGVDAVLGSLVGAALEHGLDVLAEDGHFLDVGMRDGREKHSVSLAAFRKGISFVSVDLAGLIVRRPERFSRLLAEVWALVAEGRLTPPPVTTYSFGDAQKAWRALSEGGRIGTAVLVDPDSAGAVAPEPMPGGRFRADGTYLISGGLGALGLSLAEFLAGRGAGALALVGRSAPDPEAAARIEVLRTGGVRVDTFQADIADEEALKRVRAQLPPLRGVVHAAGLLDDATIQKLRPEQLRRVLAPKAAGARNLDTVTAGDPLDFFVLFSSAAALFGNAGQAAYAAGNAFMDALAVSRRRRGLPGLSVQWGPFSDAGLAAQDANRGARLAERGMGGITTHEAWQALERFLAGEEQVVSYVPLNVRQWFEAYPDTAALRSWSTLREAAKDVPGADGSGRAFLAELRATAPERRAELLETTVRELAGRVLRLETGAIDRDTPFKALGLDSLMGLELRNRLEAAFDLKLSPTLLWTYGSTRALSGVLAEQLSAAPASDDDKD
ncbi:SDR family NAD(P)-dependent oxidoreductase [Streptomyces yunnanensis]|uniref:SDR family NAD(P)-dependent oxidoreductase n=1 Tax=Streptomyces yunnanensis TaxID=156453 RepID=A0ABY8ANP7_9ACTN|nr:type I polyketide synthase [Streptomyces yunnanensis]WEB45495.1 SDR family NAD(P)-dependent oxidoreductase [Streptomyces yunnanensis]